MGLLWKNEKVCDGVRQPRDVISGSLCHSNSAIFKSSPLLIPDTLPPSGDHGDLENM